MGPFPSSSTALNTVAQRVYSSVAYLYGLSLILGLLCFVFKTDCHIAQDGLKLIMY